MIKFLIISKIVRLLMMTKEEYEKELVRMLDAFRTSHKGTQSCVGVLCKDCPLALNACKPLANGLDIYKAFEAVENWVKEHPKRRNKHDD